MKISLLICNLSVSIFCLLISGFATAAPTKLQSHKVVIKSDFKQKFDIPTYTDHTYDLQKPETIGDPFLPKFELNQHLLPDGFVRNTAIAGLSSFSGGLAKLFLGNKGYLDIGIIEFYEGTTEAAIKEFQAIIDNKDEAEYKDLAKLWLARIAYSEKRTKDAAQYYRLLHQSEDVDIKREAIYFNSLLLIQEKNYLQQLALVKASLDSYPIEQWDFRLLYASLVSNIKLGQWQEAKNVLEALDKRPFSHQLLYYKVKQFAGIVNYALSDFEVAIKQFKLSKSYYPVLNFQQERNRNIAWIQYILGDYKTSLNTLKVNFRNYKGKYLQELKYLNLVNQMRLSNWKVVEKTLYRIPKSSIFYIYAAYQVRSNLKDVKKYKKLYNVVASEQYNYPIMRFNVALLNGNHFFEKGVLDAAQSQYIKAMSVDIESHNEWIVQYNLSLAFLKDNKFKKAQQPLILAAKLIPGKMAPWFYYHILYLVYQQKAYSVYLKNFEKADLGKFDPNLLWELRFMKGGAFLAEGKNQAAINLFLKVWNEKKYLPAFIQTIKTYYQEKQFANVVKLINQYPTLKQNNEIFTFNIKSLLGLQEFKMAKSEIAKQNLKKDQLIRLRLEVWFANNMYEKIVMTIPPLLKTASDRDKRLIYYTSMGDAYFSLQKYIKSKSQYYKALKLTDEVDKRSPMLYNIILGTYLYKDYTSFLKETTLTLKEEPLTDEVRYSITMLLSDYYYQNDKPTMADRLLAHYVNNFTYQKTKSHNKRVFYLLQKKSYASCYKNAVKAVAAEDAFQRRDRIILLGHCNRSADQAKPAITKIQQELSDKNNGYRKQELEFVLSKSYYHAKRYQDAVSNFNQLKNSKLSADISLQGQFILVNSHYRLKQFEKAETELGNVNQYRQNKTYVDALYLKSKIKQAQNNQNISVRTLLRIFYLPETNKIKQQAILLKIADIFLNANNPAEAKKYISEVKYNQIRKIKTLKDLYFKLKSEIITKLAKQKKAA